MGTILIIDDDQDIRESVGDCLIDSGYSVAFASNGQEGLEYLLENTSRPCFVLLDLMMPVMDGMSFRKEQLKTPGLSEVPVVLFSADPQLHKKAGPFGFQSSIKKPIDLNELLTIAEKYC